MNFYLKSNQEQKSNKNLLCRTLFSSLRSENKKKSEKYFWFLFSVVFLFSFIGYSLFFVNNVFAAKLSNRELNISDSRQSVGNVTHDFKGNHSTETVKCLEIEFCTTATGTCTAPTGMDASGGSKDSASWSGWTPASWTGAFSISKIQYYNTAGEVGGDDYSFSTSGIINPSNGGTFFGRVKTYNPAACTGVSDCCAGTTVDDGVVPFTIIGPGISITMTVPSPYATVVFKGKAYPTAFMTILKDGSVAATFQAQSNGYFTKTLTGLEGGIYTFGIWAEDTEGRRSVTLSFTIPLPAGATTTISGIFIPPTIDIDKIKLAKGATLNYKGQSYPLSAITIFIFSDSNTKKTRTSATGKWKYALDTSPLSRGSHTTKSKAQTDDGEQSTFSETLTFELTHPCPGADLNHDGRVNLIDFSILLYWWQKKNACADQNEDGTVNLIDFSIMLYYWTG